VRFFQHMLTMPATRTGQISAWTEFKGDRGAKSKPIPGPHLSMAS
jgi:hypothetical protein